MTDTTDTAPLGAEAQWLLAELERLEKEATPRPWRVEEKAILGPDIDGLESVVWDERSWARGEHYSPTKTQAVANAKIATNLRNHLPQILTALRSLAEMRDVLKMHHDWHLQAGTIGLQDGDGGWIAIDNAAEYSDSALCVRTTAALASIAALSQTQERKG